MSYDNIIVKKIDPTIPNSYMITEKIIGVSNPNKHYYFSSSCSYFEESDTGTKSDTGTREKSPPKCDHSIFNGIWNHKPIHKSSGSNILGDNCTLNLVQHDNMVLDIPVVTATTERLNFYGAKLVNCECDSVQFQDKIPIAIMNIGKNYSVGYLSRESMGGGVYLEHHNLPHFHMPLGDIDTCTSGGYLVLSKLIKKNTYAITGFKIPYGFAIITPPNVLHNDCMLTGRYIVVYGKSSLYSTALLKNRYDQQLLIKAHYQ